MLAVYWEIGNAILHQQQKRGWGAKIINQLAADLKNEFPDLKSLSIRNLQYMRAFAGAYPDFGKFMQDMPAQIQIIDSQKDQFVQAVLAQLSWYHHCKK